MNRIYVGILGVLLASIIGLSVVLYSPPQVTPDEEIPLGLIGADEGVVLRPGVVDPPILSRDGRMSIEEARALVNNIPLKSPDREKIPAGFDVKGVWYQKSNRTYEFEGKEYTIEEIGIFLWDKELMPETRREDMLAAGGISIGITYALGSNETATIIAMNIAGDFSYLWGYATVTTEGYLVHFNHDTGMTYRITGNYPTPVLVRVLESVIA